MPSLSPVGEIDKCLLPLTYVRRRYNSFIFNTCCFGGVLLWQIQGMRIVLIGYILAILGAIINNLI